MPDRMIVVRKLDPLRLGHKLSLSLQVGLDFVNTPLLNSYPLEETANWLLWFVPDMYIAQSAWTLLETHNKSTS